MNCSICGKQHGSGPSYFNKWHQCRGCDAIFCDSCGKEKLKPARFLSRERICSQCGRKTRLI